MVRGEILEERSHRLPHRGLMKQVRIKVRGKTFVVFLVDLSSNPLLDRGTVLFELAQHVRRCGTEPLIVMGDFNTPPDSVHFRDLRAQMTLAHQRSGSGYAPTWPLPLPVLQIDQIWTNPKVSVTLSRGGWSWLSDHRAIVADFSIED
jgi:endonuclease/exonuclease/phosphatase (EEP) superfamily protein YafD